VHARMASNYDCGICFDPVKGAVKVACCPDSYYCSACLDAWLQSNPKCPHHGFPITAAQVCVSVSVCVCLCLCLSLSVSISVSVCVCVCLCVFLSQSTSVFLSSCCSLSFSTCFTPPSHACADCSVRTGGQGAWSAWLPAPHHHNSSHHNNHLHLSSS
jgi:hypothetical protein